MQITKKTIIKILVVLNLFGLTASTAYIPFIEGVKVQYAPVNFAVGQTLQEQLDELNKQLENIQKEKDNLQSQLDQDSYIISGYNEQLSRLFAEADLYNKQVEELNLQVKQIELQIDSLNQDIESRKLDIKNTENTIVGLEEESQARIKDNYFNFRLYRSTDSATTMFNLTNINTFFKTSQYKEIIQSGTNDVMIELANVKQSLQDQKIALDTKLLEVNKEKELLDVKKADLAKRKEEADIKINAYLAEVNALQQGVNQTSVKLYAFSEEENQTRAQANKIQQEILNSYVPANDGQYVVSGTYIGKQGCTGLCTGAHLHFMVYVNNQLQSPCGYLKSGVLDGCGGGSLDWPIKGSIQYTSGYGQRCFWWGSSMYCDNHTGIDLVGSPWNAPIFAAHDGYVHKFWNDGYGAMYIILCQNRDCSGLKTGYWHLSEF